MTMENRCDSCRFQFYGQCRRYAPRPSVGMRYAEHVEHVPNWPAVKIYEDGCGEFEPQPPAPPPKEFDAKPTKAAPCVRCKSIDGKTFLTTQDFSECPHCGATDEIPF